jgi:hypothetical protein
VFFFEKKNQKTFTILTSSTNHVIASPCEAIQLPPTNSHRRVGSFNPPSQAASKTNSGTKAHTITREARQKPPVSPPKPYTIRDEGDFTRHVDYIQINPVEHGLVTRVIDWPLSSFHRYVRASDLPTDWAGTTPLCTQNFGERC